MSQRKDGNDFVGLLHLKWLRYTGVRWASYLCAIRCTLACGEHRISDANRCTPDQMILSVGYATGSSSHWSRKRLSPRDSTCSVVRRAFQSNCLLPAVSLRTEMFSELWPHASPIVCTWFFAFGTLIANAVW